MTNVLDSETRLKEQICFWNMQIEQMEFDAEQVGPDLKDTCSDTIGELIAAREGARRGLLQLRDSEPCLCASCPLDDPGLD